MDTELWLPINGDLIVAVDTLDAGPLTFLLGIVCRGDLWQAIIVHTRAPSRTLLVPPTGALAHFVSLNVPLDTRVCYLDVGFRLDIALP
jgi:hypothetical protein